MKLRSLAGALGTAALVASSFAGASAQADGPNYRQHSEVNVARMGERVGAMVSRLQSDQRDYGGHRANAVRDLQTAQNELAAAAQFAAANGYTVPDEAAMGRGFGGRHGQTQSDDGVARAQQNLARMIARLQRDSRDFGGHKGAAISALQAADGELGAAVQFAGAHGY